MPDTHSIPFGGQEVASMSVKVTNAGDGLTEALRIDPVDLKFGQRVYQVIEGFVVKAEVEPENHLDPQGKVKVKYVIKAGTSTLVDEGTVVEAINLTRDRILAAQEAAAAQAQLEGTERPTTRKDKAGAAAEAAVAGAPVGDGPHDEDGFHDPALAKTDAEATTEPALPGKSKGRAKKETVSDA